jgi:VWFA-related protein
MSTRLVFAVSAMAAAAAFALAQNQGAPPPDTIIRINVNLVQVDAVVTDSKGRPVTDLKADDFEIKQDGKIQKITNFTYISTRPASAAVNTATKSAPKRGPNDPPPPPAQRRNAPVQRVFALIVDDLGLSFASINYVRNALLKFVDQDMQPGDLVAIIRTSAGTGSLQQFTSDKRMLHAAIDRVRFSGFGRVDAFGHVDPMGDRMSMMTAGSLGAINYVVSGVRELPGRKAVILFTENLQIMSARGADPRAQEQFDRLVDSANRSSVVISSIDPRGLIAPEGGRPVNTTAIFNSQDGMVRLASATGGLFVHDNNDITGALHHVVEDGDGYYLIGYHPETTTFQRRQGQGPSFHNIQVHVKRPGLQVRSRKGFLGNQDAPRRAVARTPQAQLVHAAVSPVAQNDIRFQMTGLFSHSPETGPFVAALLHIDAHDIRFEDAPDGMHKAVIDLIIMTFNETGAVEDPKEQIHTLTLPDADYQNVMQYGLTYLVRHVVKKPGGYQMRIAIRDNATQKVGSASQYIEVPDLTKKRLALGSVVIQKVMPAASASGESAEGHIRGQDPLSTAATRVFEHGDTLGYSSKILNARIDSSGKAQMDMEVRLFCDGKQVSKSGPQPLAVKGPLDVNRMGASGQFVIDPAIGPGDYVLQVIITDKLADKKYQVASQWMDFEVK